MILYSTFYKLHSHLRDKANLESPIRTSLKHLVTSNFGSVAFGSFIIAVFKFVQYFMEAMEKTFLNKCLKKCTEGNEGDPVCFFISISNGGLSCLEKMMRVLNRNAYVEIGNNE